MKKQVGAPPTNATDAVRLQDIIQTDGTITKIVVLTSAAYTALGTKVSTTLYVIVG